MNDLAIFKYQEKEVRVVKDDQGEPWFVAKDVCDVLSIIDTRTIIERLDLDEWDKTTVIDAMGREQEGYIVSESGLYESIARSNKPEAKVFQKWIRKEVLPSIRKHGAYMTPETIEGILNDPDTIIKLATNLKEERLKRLALEEEKKALLPKAEFFDAVADSKDAIDLGRAAKILDCGVGRNRLFEMLRSTGILQKDNIPFQTFIDRRYFRVIEQKYNLPDGSIRINTKTLVYQKGLDYILKTLNLKPRKAA
jgi:prophage antirepressor-like protein